MSEKQQKLALVLFRRDKRGLGSSLEGHTFIILHNIRLNICSFANSKKWFAIYITNVVVPINITTDIFKK